MKPQIDIEFLMKTVHARNDVKDWLENRPRVGLDVTDVALLVQGYDYLGSILAELTNNTIKLDTK